MDTKQFLHETYYKQIYIPNIDITVLLYGNLLHTSRDSILFTSLSYESNSRKEFINL